MLIPGIGVVLAALPVAGALQSAAEGGFASTRDPVSQAIVAVILVLLFGLLALEKAHRVLIAGGAASLILAISYLTPFKLLSFEAASVAIDFNVIVLLASMMALVGVFKTTGGFEWGVARLLRLARGNPVQLIALMAWAVGILSAFADNVTTVIFATPLAIAIARRIQLPPAAFLLPLVMAANIGGTATLIGDPPNILIGSGAGLSFLDFLLALTPPVLCMMLLLEWYAPRYYRAEFASAREDAAAGAAQPAIRDPLLLRWSLAIVAVVMVGFLTHAVTGMPAAVPAAIGAGALFIVQDVLYLRSRKPSHAERVHGILHVIEREIEWPTLAFFILLFVIVGAAVATGLVDTLAHQLQALITWMQRDLGLSARATLILAALLVLWMSGVLSALIDNIPYVAVTIPILAALVPGLQGDTKVMWWALSLGACLGGNGTLIGASANVTVVGLAEKAGTHITFGEFTRFGARVSAITLLVSSAFVVSFVALGEPPTTAGFVALFVIGLATRRLWSAPARR